MAGKPRENNWSCSVGGKDAILLFPVNPSNISQVSDLNCPVDFAVTSCILEEPSVSFRAIGLNELMGGNRLYVKFIHSLIRYLYRLFIAGHG